MFAQNASICQTWPVELSQLTEQHRAQMHTSINAFRAIYCIFLCIFRQTGTDRGYWVRSPKGITSLELLALGAEWKADRHVEGGARERRVKMS